MMNQTIWFFDKNQFIKGKLISQNNQISRIQIHNIQLDILTQDLLFHNNLTQSELLQLQNLISLTYLHQPALLNCLSIRYKNNLIYTFTGDVLVAINPYKTIPNGYDMDIKELITKNLDYPHVFQISKRAKDNLEKTGKNQSILISGESGSGKTVSTRFLMNYLTQESQTTSSQEILFQNSILEAFGNAKTIRNENSSRFGKFIKLFYTNSVISNSNLTTYLLETIRVTQHSKLERNFHIFYMMLKGLTESEKQKNYLSTCQDYIILNKQELSINRNDKQEFENLKTKLLTFFTETEIQQLWNLLSAILHIGNLTYNDLTKNLPLVNIISELLQIPPDNLIENLLQRTIITKQGEIYQCELSKQEVLQTIKTVCRSCYQYLFDYIVFTINKTLEKEISSTSTKYIGILDIFGFEVLQNNTYEQMLINYTNEFLQKQFTQSFFKKEQELYEKQQINWNHIQYPNNQKLISLLNNKQTGLFFILNDCCKVNSTQDQYYQLILKQHKNHDLMITTPKMISNKEFIITHYAANVKYKTSDIIKKNKFQITRNILQIFSTIKLPLWKSIYEQQSISYRKMKQQTQFTKFNRGLSKLINEIKTTTTQYIRCIKPNDKDLPDTFIQQRVREQLEYSGIMEAIKLSRVGYPIRFSYKEFELKYTPYLRDLLFKEDLQSKDNTNIQRGTSIVFMKKKYFLENQTRIHEIQTKKVVFLQSHYRKKAVLKMIMNWKRCVILIQKRLRGYVEKLRFQKIVSIIKKLQVVFFTKQKARNNSSMRISFFIKTKLLQRKYKRTIKGVKLIQQTVRQFYNRKLEKQKAAKQKEFEFETKTKIQNQIIQNQINQNQIIQNQINQNQINQNQSNQNVELYNDKRFQINKLESQYLVVSKIKRDKLIKVITKTHQNTLQRLTNLLTKKNKKIINLQNEIFDLKIKLNSLEELIILESQLKNKLQRKLQKKQEQK